MTIDIQNALGKLLSLASTPEEPEAGIKRRLKFAPRIQISCDPTALDQFLDNTQAGTKPSAILWWPGANPADGKWFPRWLGILKLEIQVNPDLPFMLKLATLKTVGETEEAYKKSRIECVVSVNAKKLEAVVAANAVVFDLRTECYPSDDEQHKLHELLKCEQLDVSFYQRQADLVQAPASAPRDAAAPAAKPEKVRKGRKGAEPAKVGNEDALFPEAVEYVVSTGVATIPDLQLRLKITEARATELIAAMYELEVIGPADEDGKHEVRWTAHDVAETKSTGKEAIPAGGGNAELE